MLIGERYTFHQKTLSLSGFRDEQHRPEWTQAEVQEQKPDVVQGSQVGDKLTKEYDTSIGSLVKEDVF